MEMADQLILTAKNLNKFHIGDHQELWLSDDGSFYWLYKDELKSKVDNITAMVAYSKKNLLLLHFDLYGFLTPEE